MKKPPSTTITVSCEAIADCERIGKTMAGTPTGPMVARIFIDNGRAKHARKAKKEGA